MGSMYVLLRSPVADVLQSASIKTHEPKNQTVCNTVIIQRGIETTYWCLLHMQTSSISCLFYTFRIVTWNMSWGFAPPKGSAFIFLGGCGCAGCSVALVVVGPVVVGTVVVFVEGFCCCSTPFMPVSVVLTSDVVVWLVVAATAADKPAVPAAAVDFSVNVKCMGGAYNNTTITMWTMCYSCLYTKQQSNDSCCFFVLDINKKTIGLSKHSNN